MAFSDITNRRVVGIFDPRKAWKDQAVDILPARAGEGSFLAGPPDAPRLVDPATGATRAVTLPRFGDQLPSEFRLSHDERSAYFSVANNESDIWLVELVKPLAGR